MIPAGKIQSYKDLEIWQLALQLAVKVYKLVATFPRSEQFEIIPQIKDAVISISANIAESFGRFYYKDKIKFLYNARGSLLEVDSNLSVSEALGFIPSKNRALYKEVLQDIVRLGVKINNYRTSIQNSSRSAT